MTSQPDWLRLVTPSQRKALVRLFATAPVSRKEQAQHMLLATGPWPTDEADAQARAMAVIRYLTRGYRVGDTHPTTEEPQHERRPQS